jgi:hypothetical protein
MRTEKLSRPRMAGVIMIPSNPQNPQSVPFYRSLLVQFLTKTSRTSDVTMREVSQNESRIRVMYWLESLQRPQRSMLSGSLAIASVFSGIRSANSILEENVVARLPRSMKSLVALHAQDAHASLAEERFRHRWENGMARASANSAIGAGDKLEYKIPVALARFLR